MHYSNPTQSPLLSDLFNLAGKRALVIGGAGLLGSEIAFALAEVGAQVVIASRNLEKCLKTSGEINERFSGSQAEAIAINISKRESIKEAIESVGVDGLDILVNCGWSGNKNSWDSIDDDDWDYDIEICLNGVFRTIKAADPFLRKSRGVILNIASMYGHLAPDHRMYDGDQFANPPSYGAAKAGVLQLTRYCSSFLSPFGIRVNAISPGPFPFEETQTKSPEFIEKLNAKNPLGRIGQPHELKGAAVLLCSDASSFITGQNICVDGGWGAW